MSDEKLPVTDPQVQANNSVDDERREALIKLGKYTAYAAPILLATVSIANAAPLSGTPPGPPPGPTSS